MTAPVRRPFDFENDVAGTTCRVGPVLTASGDSLRIIFPHLLSFRAASSDPYCCKTDSYPGAPDEISCVSGVTEPPSSGGHPVNGCAGVGVRGATFTQKIVAEMPLLPDSGRLPCCACARPAISASAPGPVPLRDGTQTRQARFPAGCHRPRDGLFKDSWKDSGRRGREISRCTLCHDVVGPALLGVCFAF